MVKKFGKKVKGFLKKADRAVGGGLKKAHGVAKKAVKVAGTVEKHVGRLAGNPAVMAGLAALNPELAVGLETAHLASKGLSRHTKALHNATSPSGAVAKGIQRVKSEPSRLVGKARSNVAQFH